MKIQRKIYKNSVKHQPSGVQATKAPPKRAAAGKARSSLGKLGTAKFVKNAKISSQGQLTVPKPVRDLLATPYVTFVVDDGIVKIEPVRDMTGALREYAHRWPKDKSWRQIRDEAWEAATEHLLVKKT